MQCTCGNLGPSGIRTALANLPGSHWALSASLSSAINLHLLNSARCISSRSYPRGLLPISTSFETSHIMSENPTDPPKEPPKPPPKINPPPEGGSGKKPPAQNGVGHLSKDWDSLRDPGLDKREDVGGPQSKE
ncbi:hypothetical protein CLAIMM_03129 [Cladophialophora immunda]|nr:hypothetical protein CLAIMM_03129 [Cladophialophora immunda]